MKKLLCPLLILSLLSCNQHTMEEDKQPKTKAEYLQAALKSDAYKNASGNIQRVKAMLDSVKKGSLDSSAAIFVYNNSIATATQQAKTVAQVEEGMKKDTAYLKAAQLKAAADITRADSVKNKH
jgi:hypothetical protein